MSLLVGELYGELSLDRAKFTKGLSDAHSDFSGFGKELLGRATELAAGLGLAIGGAEVVKKFADMAVSAADFQQQMVKLVGTAGESEAGLKGVSDGILQMSGDVGYGAKELADGMYLVESAGFHGADGLNVLRQSAMAAKAENADMTEVANAVTTALNAYGMSASSASHVTDVLLTATAQGKMTFQDLAGSLDQILPVSSAAKISLNEVAAAIATQTAQGAPAAVAATNLEYALKGLMVPSTTAQKAIEELGLKSEHFADELGPKGLLFTLNDLTTHLSKKFPAGSAEFNAAISNILGNAQGLNAVLQLSGVHAQTFADDLAGMNSAAGKTTSAFDEMMATTGGKWAKFTAKLGADAILVGTVALPAISAVLDQLDKLLAPALAAAPGAAAGAMKVATGQQSIGQAAMSGLEGLGMKPEGAAKIAGPVTDIAATLGPALVSISKLAGPALAQLGQDLLQTIPPLLTIGSAILSVVVPAFQALVPPLLGVAGTLGGILGPVLGAVANHMNVIGPLVWIVVGAWAAWNIGLAVTKGLQMAGLVIQLAQGLLILAANTNLAAVATAAFDLFMDANPIGLVIIAVAALVAIIVLLVTHWSQVTTFLKGAWKAAMADAGAAFSALGAAIQRFAGGPLAAIGGFFSGLGSAMQRGLASVGSAFSALGSAVQGALHRLVAIAESIWANFSARPAYWIGYLITFIPVRLARIIDSVLEWGVAMAVKGLIAMAQFVASVIDEIQRLPGQALILLMAVLVAIGNWELSMVAKGRAAAANFIAAAIAEMQRLPGQAWSLLMEVLTAIGRWELDMIDKGVSAAANFASAVAQELQKLPGQVADIGIHIAQGIIAGLASMAKAAIKAAQDFISGMIGGANAAAGNPKSPAPATVPLGQALAQGVTHGVLSGTPDAHRSMRALIGGMSADLMRDWPRMSTSIAGIASNIGAAAGGASALVGQAPQYSVVVNGATMQPLDEGRVVGLLRELALLHG